MMTGQIPTRRTGADGYIYLIILTDCSTGSAATLELHRIRLREGIDDGNSVAMLELREL